MEQMMTRCFFCTQILSAARSVQSNACERCGADQLRSIYPAATLEAEAKRVRRCWQAFSVESRTVMASSNLQYRAPEGKFYYVHPDLPGKAFTTRKSAALAATRA